MALAFHTYSTNYLIDTAHGVILDVQTTPANRTLEVESTQVMIDRVEARFELRPQRLIADTAYGTAPMLGWVVQDRGIEPHIPVFDKTARKDGTFQREHFQWDESKDEYHCPAGKPLRRERRPFKKPRTHITKANTINYGASQHDCSGCSMKAQCCPNALFRRIVRSIHESARDVARRLAGAPAYEQSRRERKKVEMLFAHLKTILKFDRLRLRGLSGANDEFILAATAQNLRRMAKQIGQGPPIHRIGLPA